MRTIAAFWMLLAGLADAAPGGPDQLPAGWDWGRYPESDRIQIALLPCHAGPARSEPVRAAASGKLRIPDPPDPNSLLPAGLEWGRIESPELELEQRTLEHLETDLHKREKRYEEFEKDAALAQIGRDIRQAEDSLALAEAAEKNPKIFSGDRPLLDPASRPVLSTKDCKAALRALQTRRARLEKGDPELAPQDLQSLRTELERRRAKHADQSRRLVLSQPWAGQLLLADPRDGRHVSAGDIVGLVVSKEALAIRVKGSHPLVATAPPNALEATITLPSGAQITAPYASTGFDPAAEDTPVLRFETPLEPAVGKHIPSGGMTLTASVTLKLTGPCRIVPKLAVARQDGGDAPGTGWRDAVSRLFPGSELRAEGRTSLAILPRKAP